MKETEATIRELLWSIIDLIDAEFIKSVIFGLREWLFRRDNFDDNWMPTVDINDSQWIFKMEELRGKRLYVE